MSSRSLLLTASILFAGNGALAFTPAAPTINNVATRPCELSSTSLMMTSNNRRNFLNDFSKVAAGAIFVGISSGSSNAANALDFDSFEKGEIASDTEKCDPKKDPKCIPKLSKDEALCQYGGGGDARGEACMRVRKAGGKLPEVKKEKSLGGAYAM
ncbi:hypothetical protein ACHAXR_007627 [Thalassiosira sp. AJA248-18]